VVNRNLGGLDPIWDKVMVKFKDGRERKTVGRPSQARRYQTRLRSNTLGQERERESVIMSGVTAVDLKRERYKIMKIKILKYEYSKKINQ
jgi:hypothetical protein